MRRQWDRRDNVKLGWDVTYRQDWLTWLIVARITEESSEDYGAGMDFQSDTGPLLFSQQLAKTNNSKLSCYLVG